MDIFGTTTTLANNLIDEHRQEKAREENYMYGEKAANNADARTRALYRDIYSPKAQIQQLKEAGLSPSIYASNGLAGKSGATGAQGSGAQGISPNTNFLDPLTASQIKLNNANAANLNQDTTSKELDNEVKKLNNSQFKSEWEFLNLFNNNAFYKDGQPISIYDIAETAGDYKTFKDALYQYLNNDAWTYLNTPNGDQMLRKTYESLAQFKNEISVLKNSQENADLMYKITSLMNDPKFINDSVEYKKEELAKAIEDAKLTGRERQAYNNLLDKMGENTWTDIAIVLLSFINQHTHANVNLN